MTDEKKITAYSTIQRALGMIEGASSGVEPGIASTLIDAIQMIDSALEVLQE